MNIEVLKTQIYVMESQRDCLKEQGAYLEACIQDLKFKLKEEEKKIEEEPKTSKKVKK